MKTVVLLSLLLMLTGLAQAEEFVYIRSLKADLYAEPVFSAEKLGSLPRGTKVIKLQEQGSWYFLQDSGVTGWVSRLLVSTALPLNRARAIKVDSEIGNNARRRASAVATAGAARGLTADDRRRKSQDNSTDYSALEAMEEKLVFSEAEVIDFLDQGLGGLNK